MGYYTSASVSSLPLAPFGNPGFWRNYGSPEDGDSIYLHSGAWRSGIDGGFEMPPPSHLELGELTVDFGGIGGQRIEHAGRDWDLEALYLHRGDFSLGLGGHNLTLGALRLQDFPDWLATPAHRVPLRPTADRRHLTIADGTLVVPRLDLSAGVPYADEPDFSGAPTELRLTNTRVEATTIGTTWGASLFADRNTTINLRDGLIQALTGSEIELNGTVRARSLQAFGGAIDPRRAVSLRLGEHSDVQIEEDFWVEGLGSNAEVRGQLSARSIRLSDPATINAEGALIAAEWATVGGVLRLNDRSHLSLLDYRGNSPLSITAEGQVHVLDGSRVSLDSGAGISLSIVGAEGGPGGLLAISGAGSRLDAQGRLSSRSGARVHITHQGALTTKGSQQLAGGELVVDNASIESREDGRLVLFQGATARFSNNAIASFDGQLRCDGVCVVEGGATLTTAEGGSSTDSSGIVGRDIASRFTLTGEGSTWRQDGVLTAGWRSQGQLEVLDGASLHSLSGVLGRFAGATGEVSVIADATVPATGWTVREDLTLGGTSLAAGGEGSLWVEGSQAFVEVGRNLLVRAGSRVEVIDGGDLRVGDGPLRTDENSIATLAVQTGSRVTIEPGGALSIGADTEHAVADTGLLVGPTGSLSGTGLVIADQVFSDGLVSPGNSPGELTIAGDFILGTQGRLVLEVGGSDVGRHDRLTVLGDSTLLGVVEVRFTDGYVPQVNDAFDLLGAGGAWDLSSARLVTAGLPSNLSLGLQDAQRTLRVVVAEVPEPCAGVLLTAAIVCTRTTTWRPRRRV